MSGLWHAKPSTRPVMCRLPDSNTRVPHFTYRDGQSLRSPASWLSRVVFPLPRWPLVTEPSQECAPDQFATNQYNCRPTPNSCPPDRAPITLKPIAFKKTPSRTNSTPVHGRPHSERTKWATCLVPFGWALLPGYLVVLELPWCRPSPWQSENHKGCGPHASVYYLRILKRRRAHRTTAHAWNKLTREKLKSLRSIRLKIKKSTRV